MTFLPRRVSAPSIPTGLLVAALGLSFSGCATTGDKVAVSPDRVATTPAAATPVKPVTPAGTTSAPIPAPAVAVSGVTWSNPETSSVGEEFKSFHGRFNAEPVAVTLHDLPEHGWVRARFKVLVIGTWDGSNRAWGPDLWSLQVRGGQQLMLTGFSNMRPKADYYVQAFPDDFPWGSHYAFTGGEPLGAKAFLGSEESPEVIKENSWYLVEVVFPHTGKEVTLDFAGIYDDPPEENQCWGIADFEYSTTKAPVALEEGELETLWGALASEDAVRANAALWECISSGDAAVKFITAKVARLEAGSDQEADPLPDRFAALRLRRAQKILRIADAAGTASARTALTYLSARYPSPPESPN